MLRPDDISAVFEWVELLLIKSLKRNLSRHKQEEEEKGFNWTAWQAEKLRNVDTFRRQSKAIMDRYTDVIDSETRELLEEQFAEGVNGADVPPADNIPDTPAEITPEPHFFGVDRTKVNKLIEDVSYLEKNAETAALRLTDDVYRQTVNRVQLAMSTGSISYGQAVDMAVADFLTQGINCIEYKDGRRVNIADYVRMVLRTTSTRAALQGKSAKFKAQGYDTVLVSSYGMCSKTCLPWQGRAYIEDTFSYWDGEVEERNGILYGKSHYCDKWFPLLSSAIEKGLFHPNCRHSINQYIDGVTKLPEPVDNSDIERRYKLEQRQRALEREVRKAKRKVEGFTDAENIKKAKTELREAQRQVREYIAKVNADEGARVLVRNPLQEKIYSGDVRIGSSAEPVNVHNSSVDNFGESGIIEEKEVEYGVPYGKYSVDADMDYINSDDYASIFNNISDNPAVNRTLLECARKSIDHRNGTKFEDMYFIHAETGEILAEQVEMSYPSGISYNDDIKALLKSSKEEGIPLVTIHNHPEGYPPSVDDLNKSYENGTVFGIAAGHNGQVYKYNNPGKKTEEADIIHQNIALLCGDGAADPDRIYKEEFKIYGLSYEIVKGK